MEFFFSFFFSFFVFRFPVVNVVEVKGEKNPRRQRRKQTLRAVFC